MKYWYNNQWNELTLNALDGMPIGSIIQFAGSVIPTGWLICDGSSLSEEEYPQLYDVIGHTYGGTGLSFNLPNFKGRVPVGQDTSDTDFDTLGETGGEKTHYHTGGSHTHGLSNGYACIGTGWDGSNILRQQTKGSITAGTRIMSNMPNYSNTGTSAYDATALGGSTDAGGVVATTSSSSLQPSLVVHFIIKATQTTPTFASIVNANSNSTTDSYSCNYINDINTYSTSEIDTGKTWLDGKKIYRKTFDVDNLAVSTSGAAIPSGLSNVGVVTKIDINAKDSSNVWYSFWHFTDVMYQPNGNIRIYTDSSATFTKAYITIEYTKTTD